MATGARRRRKRRHDPPRRIGAAALIATIRRLRHGPLRQFAPLWVALGRVYRALQRRLPIATTVAMRIGPHGPFRLDGRFAFSNFEAWGGGKNAGFLACIESCANGRCFLDIGAHIGLVSLPAARVMAATGRVVAFEPAAFNRKILQRHVRLNEARNIEVVGDLVGDRDAEEIPFFEQDTDYPMNSVAGADGEGRFVKSLKRQVSIDSFCEGRDLSPDVIKIDVEGAELAVLEGAAATIRKCRPVIFLSVHPRQLRMLGVEPRQVAALVAKLGYDSYDSDGHQADPVGGNEYILRPRAADA